MGNGTLSRRNAHHSGLEGGAEFMARMYKVLTVGFALIALTGIANAILG